MQQRAMPHFGFSRATLNAEQSASERSGVYRKSAFSWVFIDLSWQRKSDLDGSHAKNASSILVARSKDNRQS
jgi:hypothetical protein